MVVVVGNAGVRAVGFPEQSMVVFGKSGLWGETLASGAGDSGLTCSLALDLVALGLGLQPSLDVGQDTALRGSQTAGSLLSSWSLRPASCRGRLGVLSCFPRPDSLEGESNYCNKPICGKGYSSFCVFPKLPFRSGLQR